jgi:hypothetical protein
VHKVTQHRCSIGPVSVKVVRAAGYEIRRVAQPARGAALQLLAADVPNLRQSRGSPVVEEIARTSATKVAVRAPREAPQFAFCTACRGLRAHFRIGGTPMTARGTPVSKWRSTFFGSRRVLGLLSHDDFVLARLSKRGN